MKVAIVGAGKIRNKKVANALLEGDHEITVIDISETVLSRISQQMDVCFVNASWKRHKVLKQCGIDKFDFLHSFHRQRRGQYAHSFFARSWVVQGS